MAVIARVVQASKEFKSGDSVIVALKPSNMDLETGKVTLILGPGGPIDCEVMPDSETTLSKEQDTLFRIQYDLLVAKLAKEKAGGLLVPSK